MQASDTTQVFFDNVRVPQSNRIGEEGLGFIYQMTQFQTERLWGAAIHLRASERIIALTRQYCAERPMFGKRLLDFQTVEFRLVELETEIELLRSLVYRAAESHIAGEDVTRLTTMAKLKAGRLARQVTDSCLQYWGGMGFMWESEVARAYRDFRLASIGGGADEVMLQILSKLARRAI
jgi:citronellyl-CoA dehydrogenase